MCASNEIGVVQNGSDLAHFYDRSIKCEAQGSCKEDHMRVVCYTRLVHFTLFHETIISIESFTRNFITLKIKRYGFNLVAQENLTTYQQQLFLLS